MRKSLETPHGWTPLRFCQTKRFDKTDGNRNILQIVRPLQRRPVLLSRNMGRIGQMDDICSATFAYFAVNTQSVFIAITKNGMLLCRLHVEQPRF